MSDFEQLHRKLTSLIKDLERVEDRVLNLENETDDFDSLLSENRTLERENEQLRDLLTEITGLDFDKLSVDDVLSMREKFAS